jgi:hypothetical protein
MSKKEIKRRGLPAGSSNDGGSKNRQDMRVSRRVKRSSPFCLSTFKFVGFRRKITMFARSDTTLTREMCEASLFACYSNSLWSTVPYVADRPLLSAPFLFMNFHCSMALHPPSVISLSAVLPVLLYAFPQDNTNADILVFIWHHPWSRLKKIRRSSELLREPHKTFDLFYLFC